jgi:hypothetical protein
VWSQSAASLAVHAQQMPDPLRERGDCLLWHDPAGQIKPALANHEGFQRAVHLSYKLAPQPYRPSSVGWRALR